MSVVGRGEGGEGNFRFTASYFFSIAISMNTFIRVRKSSFFVVAVVVLWKYTNHFLDFFYTNRILKITVYMMLSFSNTNTRDKKWYATLIILFGYVTRRRDGNFNDPTPLSLHSNTTALKHGIRKRKQNTECGIRERRFQAIDLKKYIY